MAWYDKDWKYRFKLTVDNTKVSGDLTAFPLLITEANMPSTFWSLVQADGSDIVLTEDDGITKLYRELVAIDTTGETMELWVNTDLADLTDTDIYLYFNNPVATETNDTETWDTDFLGVWHMEENPATEGGVLDSTSNGKDAANFDGGPAQVTGKVGKAVFFTADGLDTTIADALGDFTVELWFNAADTTGPSYERLIDKNYPTGFYAGRFTGAHEWGGNCDEPANPWGRGVILADTQWHQFVTRRIGTTHNIRGDGGSVVATGEVGSVLLSSDTFSFGKWFDNGSPGQRLTNVAIDEARFSSIGRSNDWLATSYETVNDPSIFYSAGSLERDTRMKLSATLSTSESITATLEGRV